MTILGITCQRDDGPYLVEWLAHHFAAGIDHMLVLSHDCNDGSDRLLSAVAQDHRITHLPFVPRGKQTVQWQALKQVKEHPLLAAYDWALFFDCDEFLCLPREQWPITNLKSVLAELEAEQGSFDALALPWRLFGNAGQKHRHSDLTPARFDRAAPRDLHFPFAHMFKTLFRPNAFRQLGVHRPKARPNKPARWLGPDGAPLPAHVGGSDRAITLYRQVHAPPRLWLNHYALRSVEEFLVKRARGLPNHTSREIGIEYWAERNWNTETNRDILPMLDETRAQMTELLALPGAQDAHAECVAWHQAKAVALLEDIDELRLAFRLGFLTGSTPPSAAEGRAFVEAQIQRLTSTRGTR